MSFNDILEKQIREVVDNQIRTHLEALKDELVKSVIYEREAFPNTRYLSPTQVCQYIGKKSKTGLREFLADSDVHPTEINQRVLKYDKREIDLKFSMRKAVDDYIKALTW